MSELALGQLKGLTVNSNKITVPSGHTLYAPGHVVQVVSVSSTTEASTTSTSFTSSGLEATITPRFSTSKIFVIVTSAVRTNSTTNDCTTSIFRGGIAGINLGNGAYGMGRSYAATSPFIVKDAISVFDSPATTLATTYTYAFRSGTAGSNVTVLEYNTKSSITLMEIAA